MTTKEKKRCEKTMFRGGTSRQCLMGATIFHNGKNYCGTHDPVKRKVKNDERVRITQLRMEGRRKESERLARRKEYGEEAIKLVETLADDITSYPQSMAEQLVDKYRGKI